MEKFKYTAMSQNAIFGNEQNRSESEEPKTKSIGFHFQFAIFNFRDYFLPILNILKENFLQIRDISH